MYTDSISEIDLLDREKFAKGIAHSLFRFSESNTDGFVTAITGKWGTGKSTLMKFVVTELIKEFRINNADFKVVEFNPWMFANESEIRKGFLSEYIKAFEGFDEIKKREDREVLKHKVAKTVSSAFPQAKGIVEEIETSLKKYTDKSSLSFKNQIDHLLLESNRKIIVSIDDIDRLPPKLIFELFQLLKLTCNFKNTFYLIAYDREAVELSIESQFKDYGKKFLDKIVQAEFLVPEIKKEKLQSIFFAEITKLFSDLEIDIDMRSLTSIWNFKRLKYYFLTLRDIYRYLNSIRLTLPLIHEEINIIDFLLLEAIRLNDFEVYNKIYKDFGAIVFSFDNPDAFSESKKIEQIENLTTRELVTYLFPLKPNIHSNQGKKRIFESMFFERYFSLQINKNDILQDELTFVFTKSINRVEFFQRILKEGRFDNFLSRFTDEVQSNEHSNWDFSLITDLFDFFSYRANEIEHAETLSDTIVYLLGFKHKQEEDYFSRFVGKLLSPVNTFDKARIYFYHFLIASKLEQIEMPSLWSEFIDYSLTRYTALHKFYMEFLNNWAHHIFYDNKIFEPDSYYTKVFILDYRQLYEKEYIVVLEKLFNARENLIAYCSYVLSRFSDDSFRFDLERLNKYIPLQMQANFYDGLKRLDLNELSKAEAKSIKYLINWDD